jgi:hypothetical protein
VRVLSDAELLELYLKEMKRRGLAPVENVSFLDPSFEIQYNCGLDKSLLKAIQCTRRSGKSTGEVKAQLQDAYDFPGTKHLYMALTLDSAKNIAWDIFIEELEKKKIEFHPNNQRGIITLKNGSEIRLFGLDATYKQIKKVLGGKYKSVKIDEAGSMTQDLRSICYQMIMPALADLDGTLTLLGTAENIPNTFFEKVTSGIEPGWKVYKWTAFDNPYMKEKWQKLIDNIKVNNPKFMLTSEYKTHYLNEWCADDNLLIIKLMPYSVISPINLKGYDYLLAVDLGYDDDSSFAVIAHSPNDPRCYVVETYKSASMDFTDVATTIKNYKSRYPISRFIVDGANKQGVQEMRKRHKLPLAIAEKQGKPTYLRLLRDDVLQERIVLFEHATDAVQDEWKSLQWKDENRQEEDPRCANHLSDAVLYGWREARNYTYTPPEKKLSVNSDEYMKEFEKKEQQRLAAQIKEQEYYINMGVAA